MASIWSRNKIWGGTFNTDVDVSDNTNNASVVPASNFLGLVQGSETDPRNRSKWFSSVIGQLLRAVLHKEEDRDSVTTTPSTLTKYVAKDQLPEITSVDNNMTDGSDTAGNINMFDVATDVAGINKLFKLSFSSAGLTYLKARTWLQSDLEELINTTVIDAGIASRVGTISSTAHTTDDTASRNIIIDTRTIGKGSSGATLNDDKYETLWKHLYDKYPDAICTLNVARTTRDADWTANRTLTLPKIYGRVLVGKDAAQTEFDTIGETGGAKTHTLVEAEIPPFSIDIPTEIVDTDKGALPSIFSLDTYQTFTFGGGQAHNNLQPYVVLNYQITY